MLTRLSRFLRRLRARGLAPPTAGVIRLHPLVRPRGRALMSYGQHLYRRILAGEPQVFGHPASWVNLVLARAFLDRGFSVDCVDWQDEGRLPGKTFDVVLDVSQNLERFRNCGVSGAPRILYPMFMHASVHNALSRERHESLLARRGIDLPPNKLIRETGSSGVATDIVFPGGNFAAKSFALSRAGLHRIPQVRPFDRTVTAPRDLLQARSHFLWIGGFGKVHKGLDITLEAFERMPDTHLWVCADLAAEPAFEAAFHRELHSVSNIHLVGHVDTQSEYWAEITTRCLGVVSASAAEVRVTSPMAAMRCGLIPLLSEGNDIDAPLSTIRVAQNSVEAIESAVRHVQGLSDQELLSRSEAAREEVATLCGRESFVEAISAVFDQLLGAGQVHPETPDLANIQGIGKIEVVHG